MNDKSNDTREKLEEDCEKLIGNIQKRVFSGRDAGALRCQLEELLDRQAAITTQECTDVYVSGCEACRRAQKREVVELQVKVDELQHELETRIEQSIGLDTANKHLEAENAELKSRHCPHYHVKEHYCDVHETRIAELLAKVDA